MRAFVTSVAFCFCLSACYRAATPNVVLASAGVAPPASRYAPHSYKTVFSFDGAHGSSPNSPLTIVRGKFYGTTEAGGDWSSGGGTVFTLTTGGTEKVLHSFGKGADGKEPVGSLTLLNGTLYGTTSYGGKYGGGVVFSVTLSGSEHVLHNFGKGKDGKLPGGGLTAFDGVLYGTTEEGGQHGSGVTYSITTEGDESVVYDFPRGYSGPSAATLRAFKGSFYGTRFDGGCGNGGEAFSATTDGKVNFLYTFGRCQSSTEDGLNPDGALVAAKSMFYGVTFDGGSHLGGVVYGITPGGKEHVVYNFGANPDGREPECVLLALNGVLYGVTITGGKNIYGGTVFSVTPSGHEQVLYNFGQRPDGYNPDGGLVNLGGVLYGTTRNGGDKPYGSGTVFSIVP
jgi:uncharacterized repeat protein (TIGR03803 family)